MDLIDKIRDLWLERNSKGIWYDKDKNPHFIENLTDKHLMSLPKFLANNHKITHLKQIPWFIRQEIEERDMTIDPQSFYVTKNIKEISREERISLKEYEFRNRMIERNKRLLKFRR